MAAGTAVLPALGSPVYVLAQRKRNVVAAVTAWALVPGQSLYHLGGTGSDSLLELADD